MLYDVLIYTLEMNVDENVVRKEFIPSEGLTSAEAEKLLHQWGPNELEEKVTPGVFKLYSQLLFSLSNILCLYLYICVCLLLNSG